MGQLHASNRPFGAVAGPTVYPAPNHPGSRPGAADPRAGADHRRRPDLLQPLPTAVPRCSLQPRPVPHQPLQRATLDALTGRRRGSRPRQHQPGVRAGPRGLAVRVGLHAWGSRRTGPTPYTAPGIPLLLSGSLDSFSPQRASALQQPASDRRRESRRSRAAPTMFWASPSARSPRSTSGRGIRQSPSKAPASALLQSTSTDEPG